MKLNKHDKIVDHNSAINYCCTEIMSSVPELNDKQYDQLFKSLCKLLKKTPKVMNEEIYDNDRMGSPVIK